MRVVIVGGGLTGLALARLLRGSGIEPIVLERGAAGSWPPRPFLLPFHGFACLREAGVFEQVHAAGWEVAPRGDGDPVAIAVAFTTAVGIVAEGIPVRARTEVVALLRERERVVGVRVRDPSGEHELPADLVVACDGIRSAVRDMAGIPADLHLSEGAHMSFMTDTVIDRSFAMEYLSDGRQIGLVGWPEGSAGWWDVDRVGRDAALAPGLDAFKAAFGELLPPARPALAGLTSIDQLVYREITEVRCPQWWVPGVVVVGDAAHFLGPEAGLGAGLGLADALALATAVARNRDDPDAACADYEHWHGPMVRPYEAIGAAGVRVGDRPRPPRERWPPPG
jgi:2-polyprenyl-6-methoxyphenol hydroxylase-like FAD-dependent oxidoreductase